MICKVWTKHAPKMIYFLSTVALCWGTWQRALWGWSTKRCASERKWLRFRMAQRFHLPDSARNQHPRKCCVCSNRHSLTRDKTEMFSTTFHSFIHSFTPLTCAECDHSLPFSGTSSIPLCYIPIPSILFHQLVFHPPSLHLAIYFLVYLSALLLPNSYTL